MNREIRTDSGGKIVADFGEGVNVASHAERSDGKMTYVVCKGDDPVTIPMSWSQAVRKAVELSDRELAKRHNAARQMVKGPLRIEHNDKVSNAVLTHSPEFLGYFEMLRGGAYRCKRCGRTGMNKVQASGKCEVHYLNVSVDPKVAASGITVWNVWNNGEVTSVWGLRAQAVIAANRYGEAKRRSQEKRAGHKRYTYASGEAPMAGDLVEFGSRSERMLVTRVDDGPDYTLYVGGGIMTDTQLPLMKLIARHGVPERKDHE